MPSIFLKKFFFSFTIIFMVFFFSGKNFAGETLEKILAMKYIAPNVKQVIGFTNYDGDWKAENEIVSVNAAGGAKLVCDAKELQNLTEGEISVDIFCPSVADNGSYTNAGILLKVQKPSSGADAFIGYEIAMRPENQQLNVGRHRFNYEPIARVACENSGVQTDQWWTLRVRFRERSFDVFVNDNAVFQYEDKDAPILSGGIALRPWLRPARYRNLRIKTKINSQEKWTNIPFAAPILSETEFPPSLDVKNLPPILVLTRSPHRQPSAVGQDLMQSPFEPGCSLRIIEPANPATPDKIIFSDNNGCIYDMNLSLDAKTVYFSYKKNNESFYNLWKIGIDGKNLERLTNAPFCDVSPCEIPGGDLVFVSTRRFGYTVCQPGPASNLHRLIRSGGNQGKIYCISMNTLSDMSPQMLPDGRVMFTRWEYVDRDLTFRQSVWTQNPDGTAYQLFFGNTIRDVGTFWQARPLPNQRNQVVATFAPHHGYPHGAIGIIDRNRGIEGRKDDAFRYISPEFQKIGDTNFPWGYRDPFPISDSVFLCSYGGQDGFYQDGKKRFKIYLLDSERRKRLIYEDKEQSCFFPIAIRPSENIAVAEHQNVKFFEDAALSQINENAAKPENMGTLLLINVYEGLQDKVAKGTIKSLRIMEQVRKTEELVHRAYDQSPVMSYGTYYAKRCWGTVPVEEDGSAYFYAPAMREIYLQALDADGREVQRMTSALQLTAGEKKKNIPGSK